MFAATHPGFIETATMFAEVVGGQGARFAANQ